MRTVARLVALVVLATTPVAGQVSVSGVGYLHFRYQLDVDSSLAPPSRQNNFDVGRSYINVTTPASQEVSARVTVDVDGRADTEALQFRLKYAFVRWRPSNGPVAVVAGMLPTPIVGHIERLWDYRMQGQVAIDRNGYLTSSDIGLALDGSWHDDRLQFAGGIYNGEGYQNAPGDHRKDVAARASVRLMASDTVAPTAGLQLTGYAHFGRPTGGGIRSRWLAMLSWQSRRTTLGIEHARTADSTSGDAALVNGSVTSAWATWRPAGSRLEALARVDLADRNVDVDPAAPDPDTDLATRVIVGLSYRVSPMLRVLLDADLLSLKQGSPDNEFDATSRSLFVHAELRF